MQRHKGTVKWFNSKKGYGFIQPADQSGKDVFVHITAVNQAGMRSLDEGQVLEFDLEESRGRTAAVNISVVSA
ncbi:MAG: cold-shock protein [Alphaproteobacteria bacterium]|jgi:CspA family cold shock protein|nr:cold-shock protein [Alphaproteobacteria bacterium]MBP9877878.1 cold-shock protein [Alphaproteobacteria bacterium]